MSPEHESMAANETMNLNLDPNHALAATQYLAEITLGAAIFPRETGVPKIAPTVARTTALSTTTSIENGTKSKNCGGSNLSHVVARAVPHGIEKIYGKVDFPPCYTGTPGVTSKIAAKFLASNSLERARVEATKFPA